MNYAAGYLNLHRLFRETKLGRDLLLRYAAEFPENEDYTTTGGQGVDGSGEQDDFIAYSRRLSRARA